MSTYGAYIGHVFRDPEIGDIDLVTINQQVRQFDVFVLDSHLVDIIHGSD